MRRFLHGLYPLHARRRRHVEAEIADELRFHLEMRIRDNVAAGMTPGDARSEAARRFGDIDAITAQCLCVQEDHPARLLLRGLRAVCTLGLGLGAAALFFLFVNAVFVRLPLTFHGGHDWMAVWWSRPGHDARTSNSSLPEFLRWRAQSRTLDHLTLAEYRGCLVPGDAAPVMVRVKFVSGGYFARHGTAPLIGRGFLPEEEEFTAQPVVVLSHAFWQRRYGGNPDVLGQRLDVDGRPYTIVGVMPADFQMYYETAFFAPLAFDARRMNPERRYLVAGRLKDGYTREQAQQELQELLRIAPAREPAGLAAWQVDLRPVQQVYADPVRPRVFVLLSLAGLVLLAACLHVFRQRLVRHAGRLRARVVHPRTRLPGAELVEPLVLALAGGMVGLGMASWSLDFLRDPLLGSFARVFDLRLDGRVVGFTLSLAALVGLFTGLLPVWLARRRYVPRPPSGRPPPVSCTGRYLAVSEVALALVLLVSAGLALRSAFVMEHADPGFDPKHLVILRIDLPPTRYPTPGDQARFFGEAFTHIESLPGVRSASLARSFPLSRDHRDIRFHVEGRVPAADLPWAYGNVVGRDYFRLMDIPVRQGRVFGRDDGRSPYGPVVINETAAARYWPGEDPVGQRLVLGGSDVPSEVIGVVGDVLQDDRHGAPQPEVYLLYWRIGGAAMHLILRTEGDPRAVVAEVRQVLRRMDAGLPFQAGYGAEGLLKRAWAEQRWIAGLLLGGAALVLLLATVSLCRTITETVREQTREIGVRKLLGATTRDILVLALRPALQVVGVGVGVGIVPAVWCSRLLADLLPVLQPAGPALYLLIPLGCVVLTLAAGVIPAHRAAQVDLIRVLRPAL